MSIQSRTSTDWQFGSYEADRNQQIKIVENDILLAQGSRTGVQRPGGNITVGYGWDLDGMPWGDRDCASHQAAYYLGTNDDLRTLERQIEQPGGSGGFYV